MNDAGLEVEDIEIHYIAEDDDPSGFLKWINQWHALVGFDVETGGPDPLDPFIDGFEVRLISFADEHFAWVLHPAHREAIREALASDHVFVAHNATFDVLAARRHFGVSPANVVDTLLLALMVFPPASEPDEEDDLAIDDRHRLKPLSTMTGSTALQDADNLLHEWFNQLEPRPRGGDQCDAVKGWEGRCYATAPVDDARYWVYNALDSVFCVRVLKWLRERWEGEPVDIRALLVNESVLNTVLTGVTWRGLRVDRPALGALYQAAVEAQQELLPEFVKLGVNNPASAPQVSEALQTLGVVKPVMSDAGQVSTDKTKGLPRLTEPDQPDEVRALAALLQAWRDHQKLRTKTREISALVQRGDGHRVHPQLNALKARTGRMSISRPALQNLPKKDQRIRAAFLAEQGHVLVGADFSQVELRVAAALSGDETLIEAIRAGRDLHDFTAEMIFGSGFTEEQRQKCKTVNFAVLYGAGPARVAAAIGGSFGEAEKLIEQLFRGYRGLKRYIAKVSKESLILSKSGRRTAVDPDRSYANLNYHIQGTARDVFADALLRLHESDWGDALWLVIHDEIILQVREDEAAQACAALEAAMTTTFLGVPITAEAKVLGARWGRLPDTTTTEETEESKEAA